MTSIWMMKNFDDKKIPEHIVHKLIDAANNAPSGGNMQPLSIIIVESDEGRRKLSEINGNQPWIKNAPLSMIFCLDYYRLKKWAEMSGTEFKGEKALCHFLVSYADIICASQNVVILAESYGLGSVYIGTINSCISEAREYFGIPEYVLPLMVLSLGYPRTIPQNIPKLKREVIAHHEKYRREDDGEIHKALEDKYGSLEINTENYLKRAFVEFVEAEKQGDIDWVELTRNEMKTLAIKNNAEFLFRLRYPSEAMIALNNEILSSFRKAGFDFL